MLLPVVGVLFGLVALVWSADRFVVGAAFTARHLGMSPLLVGMVVVGFGTSAPELLVAVLSALQGNPGLALGNAYGSNIANIGLILGTTALLMPISVGSSLLRKELPLLAFATLLAVWLLWDGRVSRIESAVLLLVFLALMSFNVVRGLRKHDETLGQQLENPLQAQSLTMQRALFWMVLGLVTLLASSRLVVWGAVEVAMGLGVDETIVGLTVVALGTSLPELASSITAVRKGEHDIALGNVVGSNLFNTLAVVGLAGVIAPLNVGPELLHRDVLVMSVLTASLFLVGFGFRGRPGRITRFEGLLLLSMYFGYTGYLVWQVISD